MKLRQCPRHRLAGALPFVFLVALAVDARLPAAERHALLIGISRYLQSSAPDSERVPELPGAVNDARSLHRTLVREYDFPEDHIEVLLNEQATLANLRAAMKRLAARCQAGDLVVLHFSGHGLHVPDDDGDEAQRTCGDMLDETLVPYDGTKSGENILRDDELGGFLDSLPAEELVVILDSCCSGTGTKNLGGRHARVRSLGSVAASRSASGSTPAASARPAPLGREFATHSNGGRSAGPQRRVVFSACDAMQEARESELPHAVQGLHMGTFSYLFAEGLRCAADSNGDGVVTYGEVYRHIQRRMDELINRSEPVAAYRQDPRVEYSLPGLEDAPLLATPDKPPTHLRIVGFQGGHVRLDGGAIHGVLPDQVWGVFARAEEIGRTDRLRGRLRIAPPLEPEASWGEPLDGRPVNPSHIVAPLVNPLAPATVFVWSTFEPGDATARVDLAQASKLALDRRLINTPGVRVGIENGYDLRVTLRQKPTDVIDRYEVSLELLDARDQPLAGVHEKADAVLLQLESQRLAERFGQVIDEHLREIRLRRSWASLQNPQPSFGLQLRMTRPSEDGVAPPMYRRGETTYFALKSTQDCWYVLVSINPQGEVKLLTPEPMSAPQGRGLTFPGNNTPLPVDGPAGIYVVKLIALLRPPPAWPPREKLLSSETFRQLPPEVWAESSIAYRVQ